MTEFRFHRCGARAGRSFLCLLFLLLAVWGLAGCGKKKPDGPAGGEFAAKRTPEGVVFLAGDLQLGTLTFTDYGGGNAEDLEGDVLLTLGDERWLRLWQEDDKGTTRVYLTTPQGTSMLNSWPTGDGLTRSRLTTTGLSETEEDGKLTRGFSLWVEQPSTDSTISNMLLSINAEGVLELNIYTDTLQEGEITRTIAKYTYTLSNNSWDTEHCRTVMSRRVAPNASSGNPRYGTYSVAVSNKNGEEESQLLYSRVGMEDDGIRYRVTCETNGQQTAMMQVAEDVYGQITLEESSFAEHAPFARNGDTVLDIGGKDLLTGKNDNSYVYSYTGSTATDDGVVLRSVTAGVFTAELRSFDEIYEGAISETGRLSDPRYRKHAVVRFTDPVSGTSVDVPVVTGDWLPAEEHGSFDLANSVRLVLRPTGSEGWELYAFAADPKDPSYLAGMPTTEDYEKGVKLGDISLSMVVDATGAHRYTGDVEIALADGHSFSLRHKTADGHCVVTALYEGKSVTVTEFDLPEETGEGENADGDADGNGGNKTDGDGKTDGTDAGKTGETGDAGADGKTDGTDAGEAGDDKKTDDAADDNALACSRYVELEDYPSAETVRKLFFSVSKPSDNPFAMFVIGSDGELLIRLCANGKWTDGSPISEFGYRFRKTSEGVAIDPLTANRRGTEAAHGENDETMKYASSVTVEAKETGTTGEITHSITARSTGADGADVTEISVRTVNDTKSIKAEEVLLAKADGTPALSVKTSGGELYIDGVYVDDLKLNGPAADSVKETILHRFSPTAENLVREVTTEHFTCRFYVCYDRRAAETTLDGTVVNPAKVRRTVWLELTENASGDRWSVELGSGAWKGVAGQ